MKENENIFLVNIQCLKEGRYVYQVRIAMVRRYREQWNINTVSSTSIPKWTPIYMGKKILEGQA